MKPRIITLILMMAAVSGWSQTTDTLRFSLDSCLRYAYGHNLTVRSAQMSREMAQVNLDAAKLNFTPSLSASASRTFGFSNGNSSSDGNYGVNANMTLFNGLSNLNTYRQSQVSLEQSDLKVRQSENSVGAQIVQSYLTILMNNEKLAYQQEVLKTTEQQRLEGEVKYKVGKILESDYLLLEASYQSAVSEIENTRLTIESNRVQLRNLLCVGGNAVVDVERSSDTLGSEAFSLPHFDSVYSKSCQNLPDLQISQKDVEIAEYNLKIAQAAYSPTLNLNAGSSYYGGNTNTVDGNGTLITTGGLNTNVGLSLNIPILQRGNARRQVAQSRISLQQAEMQNEQTQLDLRKEIEDQYMSTSQALNRFRASEKLEQAYKASYDTYVLKYQAGSVTTVEMLQQEDKFLSALNDFLQNKYNYILASKMLDIYMGNEVRL